MFRNRAEAAHLLARRFKGRELRDPLVLAIPRGGVATLTSNEAFSDP